MEYQQQPSGVEGVPGEWLSARNESQSRELVWRENGLRFTEIIRQEYEGAVISAGIVEGHPVERVYLRLEKKGIVTSFLLMRADELAAVAWCAIGTLWSFLIGGENEDKKGRG